MNLTTVLCAQLALVGVGTLLQLIAYRTFSRDPDVHGGLPSAPAMEKTPHQTEKTDLPAEPPPMKAFHPHVDHTPHDAFAEFHPANMAKTKRVNFKQDFKGLPH